MALRSPQRSSAAVGKAIASGAISSALIVALLSGCSSWHAIMLPQQQPVAPPRIESGKLELRRLDGEKLTLHNWTLRGDTLQGSREVWVMGARAMQPESIVLSEVRLRDGNLEGERLQRYLEQKQAATTTARDTANAPPPSRILLGDVRVHFIDGREVVLERVTVDGDSLRGVVSPKGFSDQGSRQVALTLREIRKIEVLRFDFGSTVVFFLLLGLVVVGLGLLDLSAHGGF